MRQDDLKNTQAANKAMILNHLWSNQNSLYSLSTMFAKSKQIHHMPCLVKCLQSKESF